MKYDLPEIDETALEAEAQRLWSQACGYQARLDLAEQLAHAAVEHAEAARFDEAARCGQIAKRLYTRMSNLNGLPDVGRIQYWLAAISTEVGWGVSLRRQGDCEGALAVSSTVEDALSVVREEAIQLDDADTLNEWVRTTSAHFMNKGVLLRDLGRKEEAIEAWTAANELLFDIYIRDIGPDEDVESTARVVNIWENKIVLTCEVDMVGRSDAGRSEVGSYVS